MVDLIHDFPPFISFSFPTQFTVLLLKQLVQGVTFSSCVARDVVISDDVDAFEV